MERDPTAYEPEDFESPADEDAPGEPDRDAPADGIEERGSDELMDPAVLERARGSQ